MWKWVANVCESVFPCTFICYGLSSPALFRTSSDFELWSSTRKSENEEEKVVRCVYQMQRRASDPSAMRNKLSDWLLSPRPCAEVFNVPFAAGVSVWFHFKPGITLTFDLWSCSSPLIPNRKLISEQKGNGWFDYSFFLFFQGRNITKEMEKAIFSFCTPTLTSYSRVSLFLSLSLTNGVRSPSNQSSFFLPCVIYVQCVQ